MFAKPCVKTCLRYWIPFHLLISVYNIYDFNFFFSGSFRGFSSFWNQRVILVIDSQMLPIFTKKHLNLIKDDSSAGILRVQLEVFLLMLSVRTPLKNQMEPLLCSSFIHILFREWKYLKRHLPVYSYVVKRVVKTGSASIW